MTIKVSKGCLAAEELRAVEAAFAYGYFGHTQTVIEFERMLGDCIGAEHVVASSSGTAALHLAVDCLGIGSGDEVLVPSLTFVGSFQSISATGARPIACDVHPDSLSIDVDDARGRITPRTKAIMPVHYAGSPCDMDAVLELAADHGLRVIEDAAHALGSRYKGRKIGSFGDVICFSFDSIKNITCGEGGAVVCPDAQTADVVRQKRLLGIDRKSHAATWKERDWRFEVKTQGYRYHMSSINAAIGLAQLRKLDGFIARRQEICARYDRDLADVQAVRRLAIPYKEIAPHIYVIRVRDSLRDPLMEYLKQRDIETGINYVPNHLHPFYRSTGGNLPCTEAAYGEILTLPLHCALSDADVSRVIDTIRSFFTAKARADQ